MKKMVLGLCALALMSSFAATAFDAREKDALRVVAKAVEDGLRGVKELDGKAITILPIKGDRDDYFGRLMIGAFVKAGKTCVVSNDEQNDARFKRILEEIKWDERQTTLKSVDPATIDALGKLKSTQMLIECVLDIVKKDEKQTLVELNILAYAIETKQYVWSANVYDGTFAPVKTISSSAASLAEAAQVRVSVRDGGGEARLVADEALRAVRNALAAEGYAVDGREPADVEVVVSATRSTFDKTGSWFVYEGELRLQTRIKGGKPRFMAEKVVRGKGKRGLGEKEAELSLADKLAGEAGAWARTSFSRENLGLQVVMVTLRMDEGVKSAQELALQSAFCKAAESEKGVRSVRVVRQNDADGTFVFRVVFDEAQFSDGFLNTLMTKNPGWKLGYVK